MFRKTSLSLFFASFLALTSAIEECCKNIYLFSSDELADHMTGSLGIYTQSGTIGARPYFSKNISYSENGELKNHTYFLIYNENGKISDYLFERYFYHH